MVWSRQNNILYLRLKAIDATQWVGSNHATLISPVRVQLSSSAVCSSRLAMTSQNITHFRIKCGLAVARNRFHNLKSTIHSVHRFCHLQKSHKFYHYVVTCLPFAGIVIVRQPVLCQWTDIKSGLFQTAAYLKRLSVDSVRYIRINFVVVWKIIVSCVWMYISQIETDQRV